jgi:FkbM family methyltransferase
MSKLTKYISFTKMESSIFSKISSYYFNIYPLNFSDRICLLNASIAWTADYLRNVRKPLESYLKHNIIVKTWDGFSFFVRAKTPDLHMVAVSEKFEIENWFKPLARGVVVDVGAYIGTYTVRAMRTADIVISIEPLPSNFKVLQKNVELNSRMQSGDVIFVNKAIAEKKKDAQIFVPGESNYVGTATARLDTIPKEKYLVYTISADTLDNILNELKIEKIDLLKIDIEGYVLKSLSGMLNALKRTSWLFIELLGQDVLSVSTLKKLGFRLKAYHGRNFLFKRGI